MECATCRKYFDNPIEHQTLGKVSPCCKGTYYLREETPLSDNQIKKYVNGSDRCPYCDSEDFYNEGPEESYAGMTELQFTSICRTCGKNWLEQFKLYNIVDLT